MFSLINLANKNILYLRKMKIHKCDFFQNLAKSQNLT